MLARAWAPPSNSVSPSGQQNRPVHEGAGQRQRTPPAKDRVAALNRKAVALDPPSNVRLAQRLRQIDRQIQAIDNRLRTLRGSDPDLTLRVDILTSIPGFAEPTANTLVVEASELGYRTIPRPVASSVSPPIASDSVGQTNRRRSIRRRTPASQTRPLYASPQRPSASTLNLKATYEMAMITAGKPPKVAIVAIMRKLFILANALIRDQRKWTPAAP